MYFFRLLSCLRRHLASRSRSPPRTHSMDDESDGDPMASVFADAFEGALNPFARAFEQRLRGESGGSSSGPFGQRGGVAPPPAARGFAASGIQADRADKRSRFPRNEGVDKWRRGWEGKDWVHFMDPALRNEEGTLLYDEFRKKFRVPFEVFDLIVERFRQSGLVPDEKNPKPGPRPIPVEMKVMHLLRTLAVGCPFDALEEASGVSGKLANTVFLEWVHWMVETFWEEQVRPPKTHADIEKHNAIFTKMGFPGDASFCS